MAGAILSRFAQMLFVMVGISVLVFLIFVATHGSERAVIDLGPARRRRAA